MKIEFPAMRGTIGQREYYSCLMKLSTVPKMFTFRDWVEFAPEDREQRVLNVKRVPDIARYMLENEEGYLFSSITASYRCEVKFKPLGENGQSIGTLEMDFENANFVINDGQHRCAAIVHALKENPSLGDETISVLLFNYESIERVQQMFSDLNRFVAKTSKSLDILYDKRDALANVVLEVCERVPAFVNLVEKDAMSLPARSSKLFTLAALYDANKELLAAQKADEEVSRNELVETATDYWTALSEVMPDWQKVKAGQITPIALRQERISTHSVVMRALGAVGAELLAHHPDDWKGQLLELNNVDWSKRNPDWENVCIVANSVVSNRQARAATKAYLKHRLNLPLTEVEQKAIAHVLRRDSEALIAAQG
jgi:DNA sulfur modification protein DndB